MCLNPNHLLCLSWVSSALLWLVLQNKLSFLQHLCFSVIYLFIHWKNTGGGTKHIYLGELWKYEMRCIYQVLGYYALLCTDALRCLMSWSSYPWVPVYICECPFHASCPFQFLVHHTLRFALLWMRRWDRSSIVIMIFHNMDTEKPCFYSGVIWLDNYLLGLARECRCFCMEQQSDCDWSRFGGRILPSQDLESWGMHGKQHFSMWPADHGCKIS